MVPADLPPARLASWPQGARTLHGVRSPLRRGRHRAFATVRQRALDRYRPGDPSESSEPDRLPDRFTARFGPPSPKRIPRTANRARRLSGPKFFAAIDSDLEAANCVAGHGLNLTIVRDSRKGPESPDADTTMVKRNVVANFAGSACSAVMGIVFVPTYIHYLGPEAYGIVAIVVALQSYMNLLDFGLTPMLAREMSHYVGGLRSAEEIRSLVRVSELLMWPVALAASAFVFVIANWVASSWVRSDALPQETIANALRIAAALIGLRLVDGLYRGCLAGLQLQVATNVMHMFGTTLRVVGAVAVLAWWSPTLDAFLWWQVAVAAGNAAAVLIYTYRILPSAHTSLALGARALRATWPFAGGMLLGSLLSLALAHTDKLLLSKLLSLADYGKYFLALTASSSVLLGSFPILHAIYPRLTAYHASKDTAAFVQMFRLSTQSVSVIAGATSMVLIFFAEAILMSWTRDADLTAIAGTPLKLLAAANLLTACLSNVHHAQLATGWVRVSNWTYLAALALVVPALVLAVPRFGMTGAAFVWLVLQGLLLLVLAPLVLCRIAPGHMSNWITRDCILPIAAAAASCGLAKFVLSGWCHDRVSTVCGVLIALCIAVLASSCTAGMIRPRFAVVVSLRPRH
jgi:O-antigen/teichoic acid export membrane protein